MKQFWNWLSGKKTAVAGIATAVIGFLLTKEIIDNTTAELALTIASIILGVGVSHKLFKASKKKDGGSDK